MIQIIQAIIRIIFILILLVLMWMDYEWVLYVNVTLIGIACSNTWSVKNLLKIIKLIKNAIFKDVNFGGNK